MTRDPQDEFDRLTRALRDAAPAPDPATRQKALRLAMENFDRLSQEADPGARPIPDRPKARAGFTTGVRRMLSTLTARPVLAATTSVAALCLGLFVVLPQDQVPQPQTGATSRSEPPEPVMAEAQPAPDVPQMSDPQTVPPSPTVTVEVQVADAANSAAPVAQEFAAPADDEIAKATMQAAEPGPQDAADAMPPAPPGLAKEEVLSRVLRSRSSGVQRLVEHELKRRDADMHKIAPQANTEAFANADANPVRVTAEQPVSTFSADVDTAAYAVVRSSLMQGMLPPADAVRIEEMVNYFPYDYPAPAAGEAPFRTDVRVFPTPWNPGTRLVRIGIQGRMPAIDNRPPLNLVFLIDTSGSMQDPDKLPLLQQSLRLMIGQLRPDDQIAIVAYAGSAGEVLAPTEARDSGKILAALDRLQAGGSTAGAAGLELAYLTAEAMAAEGEVSRILLATDGDFNVGISDPGSLTDYIARKRADGTYLSVLGFGRGNLDDATMQALAQNGNGQAAYIDTLQEARKVLVAQLSGALFPIANDVKIQVEWNPATVAEYRLIGYETRALAREDFNNDKIDAGDIGAGHSVTALYEVTAPGSDARLTDPLRYGTAETVGDADAELGFLRLRYKNPGEADSHLIETPIRPDDSAPDADARFAAAIAGFGQLLSGGTYLRDWGWDEAIALALEGRGDDPFGYRAEAIGLMRLAEGLEQN